MSGNHKRIVEVSNDRDEIRDEFSRAAGGLGQIIADYLRQQELQSTFVAIFNPTRTVPLH